VGIEQFTTANGLMTPSMKVSGFAVERKGKQELERLNQSLNAEHHIHVDVPYLQGRHHSNRS
jgi:hypothetical protein